MVLSLSPNPHDILVINHLDLFVERRRGLAFLSTYILSFQESIKPVGISLLEREKERESPSTREINEQGRSQPLKYDNRKKDSF